jgi:AcrR family transcriptional regulator
MTRPPADRTAGDAAAIGSGKITRDVVLAAALEIIDADGAEALSMRRLARALGRDPMILYRHAPNKAALLDGVAETVLAQLPEIVDNPDETDDLLRLGLHRLPIGEFPLLRSLAPVLAAYDGAAELERGLDILLTGLTTTLTPQAASFIACR